MPESNYKFSGNVLENYDRDTGVPSTALDWVRAVKSKKNIRVNGKRLSEYPELEVLMKYPPSLSNEGKEEINTTLRTFFKDEVLKKMAGSDSDKEAAVDYLMKNFHQGGLLRAFTLSASHHISETTDYKVSIGELDVEDMNFIATSQGFDIRECGCIKKVTIGGELIEPKTGVMNIKGSRISVNFNELVEMESKNKIEPTIKHDKCEIELLDQGIADSFEGAGIIVKIGQKKAPPKWQKFHSAESPVEVPLHKDSNILMKDKFVEKWQQAVADDLIYVNKQNLKLLEGQFNTFEDIERYCKDVLLENYSKGKDKEKAFGMLMTHLMKPDALTPVTTGVKALLEEKFKLAEVELSPQRQIARETYGINTPIERDVGIKHRINLVSTATGIEMQERVQVTDMKVKKGASSESVAPKAGKNHLIKCQATMSVDLSGDEPVMTVNANTISYGSDEVSKVIDKRSMIERIIDYLGRIFGFHNIKNITPPDQSNDIEPPGP